MKHIFFAAAAAAVFTATARVDLIDVADTLDRKAIQAEIARAPRLAAMWKVHAMGAASVSAIQAQTYTGSAITPTPTVKLNGTTLTAGTDFTYSYKGNTNAGVATVYMTAAKAGLFGTASRRFAIVPASLAAGTFAAISATNATGKAICPTPAFTVGGTTLTAGRDFTYSYADNVNAGTGTVYAVGMGNYSGTASTNFVINAVQ